MAIRRRMAAVIAEVATLPYDRWYVLAHSQGTVVAFNGLMAPAAAWPNYLGDAAVAGLVAAGMAGPRRDGGDGPPLAEVVADFAFRPAIPPRRTSADLVVYRDCLFARFRGLLTYGSPLDKFAAIWPPTVAINRQSCAFAGEAVWVNVWDPNDPVGGSLDAFDPDRVLGDAALPGSPDCGTLAAINIPCRASPVFLVSHVAYLTRLFGKTHVLARWIGDWLLGFAGPGELVRELRATGRLVGEPALRPEDRDSHRRRRFDAAPVSALRSGWCRLSCCCCTVGSRSSAGLAEHPQPSSGLAHDHRRLAHLPVRFAARCGGRQSADRSARQRAGRSVGGELGPGSCGGADRAVALPFDPRDSRGAGGSRNSVLVDDWHRVKHAVTGGSEPSS